MAMTGNGIELPFEVTETKRKDVQIALQAFNVANTMD